MLILHVRMNKTKHTSYSLDKQSVLQEQLPTKYNRWMKLTTNMIYNKKGGEWNNHLGSLDVIQNMVLILWMLLLSMRMTNYKYAKLFFGCAVHPSI